MEKKMFVVLLMNSREPHKNLHEAKHFGEKSTSDLEYFEI